MIDPQRAGLSLDELLGAGVEDYAQAKELHSQIQKEYWIRTADHEQERRVHLVRALEQFGAHFAAKKISAAERDALVDLTVAEATEGIRAELLNLRLVLESADVDVSIAREKLRVLHALVSLEVAR